MSCDIYCVSSILVVSAVWGATNPLMRWGSQYSKEKPKNDSVRGILSPLWDLIDLFKNWRFALPFLANQAASVVFTVLVAMFPVSLVVPSVNSLQIVFTAIFGSLFGEKLSIRSAIGCALIFTGVAVMIAANS